MRFRTGLTALMTLAALLGVAHAQDAREGVKLPPMMRAHMLGNMRDHLLALNQILGDVADGRFDDAGKIAESRLVIVLQDAGVTPTADSMRKVTGALHEVTSACTSCHAAYRLQ